jgi:hypothetical protein
MDGGYMLVGWEWLHIHPLLSTSKVNKAIKNYGDLE